MEIVETAKLIYEHVNKIEMDLTACVKGTDGELIIFGSVPVRISVMLSCVKNISWNCWMEIGTKFADYI